VGEASSVFWQLERWSSLSFYCLLNVEEIIFFILLKSSGGGQFCRVRLRLLTEDHILKYNVKVLTKSVHNPGYVVYDLVKHWKLY